MSFQSVFIAVLISGALLLGAFLVNSQRPAVDIEQPGPDYVKATGKCAACHERETSAVVHQYERSRHAARSVTCYDCHRALEDQEPEDHRGFVIAKTLTSANCKQCHATEYDQFVRSRHAAPAWAAVMGTEGMSAQQIALGESHHPDAVRRPANKLAQREGEGVLARGCLGCHSVGAPNEDGSIGTCAHCHSRHNTSVRLARQPQTCGQCHMGPDHSQLEIYNESKHGVLYAMQRDTMNLDADPKALSTRDMPVPTCATCHMSGLEGLKVTHDTTERLSWFLFAPVSKKRPGYSSGQAQMREVCLKCHARGEIERLYADAEVVVHATNEKVQGALDVGAALRKEGLLTDAPFDEPIEFLLFDLWHYFGRTAKHGAFMGGADFVQWHGNYELLLKRIELDHMAAELRHGG